MVQFTKKQESILGEMWKLQIPDTITEPVIENTHSMVTAAHGGVAKTLELLKTHLYWPKMAAQIKNFLTNCQICKESKP